MAVISNTSGNRTLTKENLVNLVLCVSQPLGATKNVGQPIDYKIKPKQSGFKWYAKKISGFERFLSKIRDIEKNCLLNQSRCTNTSTNQVINQYSDFSI